MPGPNTGRTGEEGCDEELGKNVKGVFQIVGGNVKHELGVLAVSRCVVRPAVLVEKG